MMDLNSRNRSWKALPDMREGKFSFNPCLFNGYVYVCGRGHVLMEVFSPQTNSFLPLQLQLPENHHCLFVHKNLLVVHSLQSVFKFSAGQAEQLIQHSEIRFQTPVNKWSNSQPVVDPSRGLFFIYQQSKLLSISIDTGALVQSFS